MAKKRKRRSFDKEFKAEAVRLCKVGDRSVREVARDLDLTETALRSWVKEPGLVHHSDRGSPYASEDYRAALESRGIIASMSRTGDCWDTVAESFFGTLKAELVEHEHYATRAAALASIADYIDVFYNLQRRHSFLDYVSPIEFELKVRAAALAA